MARFPLLMMLPLAWQIAAPSGSATMIDVTSSAGLSHIQYTTPSPPTESDFQTYMSGGAAAGDYDGDGWVDLYFTCLDGPDLLYRNLGNGTFENVTRTAFGDDHLAAVQSNGAAFGDIDNDGDADLYVTSIKSNRYHLFVNDGNGRFEEQAIARGASISGSDAHYGFSASFGDYDRDGYLDLHTTEWRLSSQNPTGADGNARLLRNRGRDGPGTFVDVTQAAGVGLDEVPSFSPFADSQSFASRFSDLDGDGHPDLAIASDHGTSRLFWNNGDGTFQDGTLTAGVGSDNFGMGSTVGDYDGDGDLDWFVTSIFEPGGDRRDGNRLYRNDGNRTFSDATDAAGVRNGDWGWGAAFFDYDNDGDLDLAQTNGVDFPDNFIGFNVDDGYQQDPTRLWENDGQGNFTEVALHRGIEDTGPGKGLLTLDYDRDGDLDLLVTNNAGPPVLYRNESSGRNGSGWLEVELEGTASNRDGIGARITVIPALSQPEHQLVRELDGGNNFLGQSERLAHFGLGSITGPIEQIRIDWPSGYVQYLHGVEPNRRLTIRELPAPCTVGIAWIVIVVTPLVRPPRANR